MKEVKIIIKERQLKNGGTITTTDIKGKMTDSLAETLINKGFEELGIFVSFHLFKKLNKREQIR